MNNKKVNYKADKLGIILADDTRITRNQKEFELAMRHGITNIVVVKEKKNKKIMKALGIVGVAAGVALIPFTGGASGIVAAGLTASAVTASTAITVGTLSISASAITAILTGAVGIITAIGKIMNDKEKNAIIQDALKYGYKYIVSDDRSVTITNSPDNLDTIKV